MAKIDPYIDALFRHGADRLALASGQRAILAVRGEERALSGSPLGRRQLEELLGEMLPADVGSDPGPGRHEFEYEMTAGRVGVRAWLTESAVRVIITPVDGNGAPAADGNSVGNGGARGPGSVASTAPGPHPRTGPETSSTPVETDGPPPLSEEATSGWVAPTSDASAAVRPEPASPPPGPEPASPPPGPDSPAIDRLFRRMVEKGCSDLHLSSLNVPLFRKDGEMVDLGGERELSIEEAREMLYAITPPHKREEFEQRHDADFAYEITGVARFRCNLFMDRKGIGGVFRVIPSRILTAEDLGLSEHILSLCRLSKGLVLVTGPTGSGKSTTLSAMIDYVNRTRSEHIITIEDPIEFVHENKRCLINQREVGVHTAGFKVALRAALREDPDVVLVGEMRDLETVSIALETAETGHLVFATLHTNTAPSTVDRIIDQFPAEQQGQIRVMLAESLKGVIAQTLCRRKGGGRVAALEILLVNTAVSNLIREAKTFQIPSMMQTGRSAGMATLNDSLLDLVKSGVVDLEEVYTKAVAKAEFRTAAQRAGLPVESLPV